MISCVFVVVVANVVVVVVEEAAKNGFCLQIWTKAWKEMIKVRNKSTFQKKKSE